MKKARYTGYQPDRKAVQEVLAQMPWHHNLVAGNLEDEG